MRAAGTCPRRSPATCRPARAPPRRAMCVDAPRSAIASVGSRAKPGLGLSRTAGELAEVRTPLLAVRVAALLRFLGPIEEEIRVVRQLLQAGKAILVGVEARLDQAQRERRQLEHLAAPAQRLFLELLQRDHGVDKAHLQRLLCVVLATEHPDLLRALLPDLTRE